MLSITTIFHIMKLFSDSQYLLWGILRFWCALTDYIPSEKKSSGKRKDKGRKHDDLSVSFPAKLLF